MGFFRKLLAKIGKRVTWWRAEKMNLYVLALMARETTLKYQEIYGGDLEKAISTLKEQFADAARSYLMNMINQLNLIMSQDLNEFGILSEVALWSLLGKQFSEFFEPATYLSADDPNNKDGVHKFYSKVPKCLMCSVIKDLDLNRYRGLQYGGIITYALGSLVELVINAMGHDYRTVPIESKCFLEGDPYSEATYLLLEKEE
jgi:hypothetical protein